MQPIKWIVFGVMTVIFAAAIAALMGASVALLWNYSLARIGLQRLDMFSGAALFYLVQLLKFNYAGYLKKSEPRKVPHGRESETPNTGSGGSAKGSIKPFGRA